MFIGIGTPIPELSNLPGASRPGGGSAFEYTAIDNSYSMEFNGTDARYIVNSTPALELVGTDFSISFWIRSDSTTAILLDKYIAGPNGWGLYLQGGTLKFLTYPSPGTWDSITTLSTNVWTHIVVVAENGNQNLKCYKNGVEVHNAAYAMTVGSSNTDLYIGGESGLGFDFDGHLDELAIFRSALSEGTAEAIYNATANNPGKVADLSETPEGAPTAWYRMGD
jgi:hypothetical protein